jgi:hypothetical protein
MILIGIDPDIEKSGMALWNTDNKQLSLFNLSFFELFDFFKQNTVDKVIIEAGWLNEKTNWHKGYYNKSKNQFMQNSVAVNERISKHTGANHEIGKKIAEMCTYLNIKYELVVPKSSKIKTEYFQKITGIKKSNQEQRDAAMLVFGF